MVNKSILTAVAVVGLGIAAFAAGMYLPGRTSGTPAPASTPLLNTTIFTDAQKDYIINFTPLRDQIKTIAAQYPKTTYVYFVYLNNAVWVGINERTPYAAASTVKVPLAMAIYRIAEEGKIDMRQAYSLDQLDLDTRFGDLYKKGEGSTFTIEDLVRIMLVYSDNTAMQALINVAKRIGIDDPFADVYTYMGWSTDSASFADVGTTPSYLDIDLKTLSRMFVSLYNADYDNVEHSQQILNYLTQSSFNDELVAGVPTGVPVAHKIGVWEPQGESPTYSDCGIVYAPNRNYILCLATEGLSRTQSDAFMSAVSKAAYQYVINN